MPHFPHIQTPAHIHRTPNDRHSIRWNAFVCLIQNTSRSPNSISISFDFRIVLYANNYASCVCEYSHRDSCQSIWARFRLNFYLPNDSGTLIHTLNSRLQPSCVSSQTLYNQGTTLHLTVSAFTYTLEISVWIHFVRTAEKRTHMEER